MEYDALIMRSKMKGHLDQALNVIQAFFENVPTIMHNCKRMEWNDTCLLECFCLVLGIPTTKTNECNE